MKPLLSIVSCFALGFLACGACPAQESATPSGAPTAASGQEPSQTIDPVGTWVWEQSFGGNRSSRAVHIRIDNGTLAGTYDSSYGNAPSRFGRGFGGPAEIGEAKLEGDILTFSVSRSFNGNEFKTLFWGVISGDEIAGVTTVNFGGQDRESEWMAQRVLSPESVAGKWNVKFETPQGEIEESFTIQKADEGDALSGTFHSSVFGESPLKDVTIDGMHLKFVVEMNAGESGPLKAAYDARPRGSEIAGNIAVNLGGNDMEITFTGTRVEAADTTAGDDTGSAAPAETTSQPSDNEPSSTNSTSLTIPEPTRIPDAGTATDQPYNPRAILPGGIVMPLYAPDSPYLNADRIKEPEQYSLSNDVHGRINSIVNIHNPSIEVHFASPSMNTGAVVILAAGGGHRTLNVGTESADFVPFFYNYGVNTVILRNRLRSDGYEPTTDAVRDALQSIRLVRKFAEQWKLDPNKIGIMGFSAGAELSAPAAVNFEPFDQDNSDPSDPLAGISSRPDFVGIIYPGPTPFTQQPEREVPRNTPPAFITCAGAGDRIHAIWATDYFSAMLRAGIPNVEMHIYGNGYHPGDRGATGGLTHRKGIPFGSWHERFIEWFDDLGFLGAIGEETKAAVDSREFVSQPPRRFGGPSFGRGNRGGRRPEPNQ